MNIEVYKSGGNYWYYDHVTKTEGLIYVEEFDHGGEKYLEITGYETEDGLTDEIDLYLNNNFELIYNAKEL